MRKGYDFFSFFVIPALTLLLAAGYELTETNFSVIGNREGRRGLFLLWGAAAFSGWVWATVCRKCCICPKHITTLSWPWSGKSWALSA